IALKAGEMAWANTSAEPLLDSVQIGDQDVPIHWEFKPSRSQNESHQASFVYESQSPRLRLTWEWRARAKFGPIEHEIRIENLDNKGVWLPLQDSLRLNWKTAAGTTLEQIYVEKGADTPSNIGTHVVIFSEGNKWEGTSSTYFHPKASEPREIIPWVMLQE